MTAKTAAIIIGLIFLAVGLLGYVDNPIVGASPDAVFHADSTHNIVHIVSGLLFLLVAFAMTEYSSLFLKIFGVVYLLIGILGIFSTDESGMGQVLGVLHVNDADNYLHIGLGMIIYLAGLLSIRTRVN